MKIKIILTLLASLLLVEASPLQFRKTPRAKKKVAVVQVQSQLVQLTFVNDTPYDVPANYGFDFNIPPGIQKFQFQFNPDVSLLFGIALGDDKPHYGYGSMYPEQMAGNNQVVVYHGGTDSNHIQFDNYFNAPFDVVP